MAGRREKKKRWGIRIPGILGLMAIMAVLFSPVGPGKAIESPVSEPEPPEVTVPQTPKRRFRSGSRERCRSRPCRIRLRKSRMRYSPKRRLCRRPLGPCAGIGGSGRYILSGCDLFGRLPYGRIFPVQRPEGRNLFLFRGRDGGARFFPKMRGPWKMEAKFLAERHGGGTVRKDLCDAGRQ